MLSLAAGQLFAVDLAIIPVLAKWLGSIGFPGAIAQVGLGYFWMLFLLFYVRPWKSGLSNPLYLYLLVGVIDFQSNFCISEAFGLIPPIIGRFMLNLTLPFTFLFQFLGNKSGKLPSSSQIIGLVLVVAGVVLAVASPTTLANGRDRTEAAKGLLFAVGSTFLGALSGISQQSLMQQTPGKETEMVACMAISAFLTAAVQLPLWELERYQNLENPMEAAIGVGAISVLIFIFYFGSILYSRKFPGALAFNLLTINGYIFLADLLIFGNWDVAEPMLGGAFVLTVGGGLVFHLATAEAGAVAATKSPPEVNSDSAEYETLVEQEPLLQESTRN